MKAVEKDGSKDVWGKHPSDRAEVAQSLVANDPVVKTDPRRLRDHRVSYPGPWGRTHRRILPFSSAPRSL